jgi:predicted lipid-binding transport protein (Tim44 family)
MRNIRYTVQQPPNLFVQIIGLILGIGLFAFAIVIGGFLLAGLLGLGLIAWLVISVRIWWLSRKAERQRDVEGHIVEAEYRVVEMTERDDRTP